MHDRAFRICVERTRSKIIEQGNSLIDSCLGIDDRAGMLTRISPFIQKSIYRNRKVLSLEPKHAFLSLHAGKPNLCGQREHVGSETRGKERFRPTFGHLRLSLVEPA